ncbi:MAG: GntR family transcriptional regulator [Zoogloeaceae bacterium]|nr:GntR family transcriptional regulator [Zoogloeaceae bacterium]
MPHSQIEPLALYQQVAERLRQRIFAHDLPPGSWVDEQALAEQYGISRTPLREALKVLAAEGLVTLKPRRGCYVTEISDRDLDEVFSVMALLEGQCAADCAQRATVADLAELERLHDLLENAVKDGDIEAYFEANQAFHRRVQDVAGNRWLQQVIQDLRKVIKLSRHHSLFSEGRLAQSLAEHRQILAAMLARDANAAEAGMRAHIASARQALARASAARTRVA